MYKQSLAGVVFTAKKTPRDLLLRVFAIRNKVFAIRNEGSTLPRVHGQDVDDRGDLLGRDRALLVQGSDEARQTHRVFINGSCRLAMLAHT